MGKWKVIEHIEYCECKIPHLDWTKEPNKKLKLTTLIKRWKCVSCGNPSKDFIKSRRPETYYDKFNCFHPLDCETCDEICDTLEDTYYGVEDEEISVRSCLMCGHEYKSRYKLPCDEIDDEDDEYIEGLWLTTTSPDTGTRLDITKLSSSLFPEKHCKCDSPDEGILCFYCLKCGGILEKYR